MGACAWKVPIADKQFLEGSTELSRSWPDCAVAFILAIPAQFQWKQSDVTRQKLIRNDQRIVAGSFLIGCGHRFPATRCYFPRMASSTYPLWFLVPGAFLTVITVVGNGLVVYLIMTRNRLHNATNWIVLSLAVADFFLGAGYPPAWILLSNEWLVKFSVLSFLNTVSALNLSLLTVDRYVFITRPSRYSTLLTTKRAVLLIVAVWLASFVPHLLLYLTYSKSDPADSLRNFEYFDIIVFEISPMLALPVLAGRIFVIVRRQERRMKIQMRQVRFNRQAEPGSEMSSHNRRTSTMKFICGAVAVFGFCYLCETLLTAYELIIRVDPAKEEILTYRCLLTLLVIVNSAINPVVYALFKSDINRSLRRMVHRNRRCWSGPKREPRWWQGEQ